VKCRRGTGQDLVAIQSPEFGTPRGWVCHHEPRSKSTTARNAGSSDYTSTRRAWNVCWARSERAPRRTGCHEINSDNSGSVKVMWSRGSLRGGPFSRVPSRRRVMPKAGLWVPTFADGAGSHVTAFISSGKSRSGFGGPCKSQVQLPGRSPELRTSCNDLSVIVRRVCGDDTRAASEAEIQWRVIR